MSTLRSIFRGPNELHYADPDSRENTLRIKLNVQPKKAGSRSVYNAQSSIIMNRSLVLPKPPECEDACGPVDKETMSMRFTVSGSTASKAEVRAAWLEFKSQIDLMIDDLTAGFIPDSSLLEPAPPEA